MAVVGALDDALRWGPNIGQIVDLFQDGSTDLTDIREYAETSWMGNNAVAHMRLNRLPDDVKWMPFSGEDEYSDFIMSTRLWTFVPMAVCFFALWIWSIVYPYNVSWFNQAGGFSFSRMLRRGKGDSFNNVGDDNEQDYTGATKQYIEIANLYFKKIQNEGQIARLYDMEVSDVQNILKWWDENQEKIRNSKQTDRIVRTAAGFCLATASFGSFFWFLFRVDKMTTLIGDGNLMAILYMVAIACVNVIGLCLVVSGILPSRRSEEHGMVSLASGRTVRVPTPDAFWSIIGWLFLAVMVPVVYEGVQLHSSANRGIQLAAALFFFAAAFAREFYWALLFPVMHGDWEGHTDFMTNNEDRHIRCFVDGQRWMLAMVASVLMCFPHSDVVPAWFQFDDAGWYFWIVWLLLFAVSLVLVPVGLVFFMRMAACMRSHVNAKRKRQPKGARRSRIMKSGRKTHKNDGKSPRKISANGTDDDIASETEGDRNNPDTVAGHSHSTQKRRSDHNATSSAMNRDVQKAKSIKKKRKRRSKKKVRNRSNGRLDFPSNTISRSVNSDNHVSSDEGFNDESEYSGRNGRKKHNK